MESISNFKNDDLSDMIRRIMEQNYDLGHMIRFEEILGGYCNKSYAVWMSTPKLEGRYFLRLYNPNVVESEILFEHALVNHLRSKGFTLAAAVIPTRNGTTLVHTAAPEAHCNDKALWALFEFLEGEDKYSWTHTDLTDNEFRNAAEILAHLHHCANGFDTPPGTGRVQPKIMAFLPTLKQTFSGFLQKAQDRRCDRLFKEHFDSISASLDQGVAADERFKGMLKIPIHCDYHPGNLKYRDEKGVGIFDFDWSKIDYRLFDVALGLVYFTSIWDDAQPGLRLDKLSLFLNAYNAACGQLEHITPLTEGERRNLIPMLSIANLYVLNWDLVDFYGLSQPDDDEYFIYINHNIGLMHWIARHSDEIKAKMENV